MNGSLALNGTFSDGIPLVVDTIRVICIVLWAIIICFGILGNCLTIAVLISPKLNNSSTTFYLTVLALIDILYLIFSLGIQMFDFAFFFPFKIRQQHIFICISLSMTSYTLAYISVWLLVAVAIDRMIWVIYPFGAKTICTRNIAKVIVSILFSIFIVIDVHFVWTLEFLNRGQGFTTCNFKKTSEFQFIFPYIDLTLIMGLPFLIMCTANVLIISKLREMEKLRKRMKSANTIQNTANFKEKKKLESKSEKEKIEDEEENIRFNKSKRSTRRRSRDKQTTSLTKMLLSVNIFFLVSTTPLLSYNVVFFVTNIQDVIEKNQLGGIIFGLERFLYTLWYLNFAVHFLLYCMSGPKFRQEAVRLLGKYFCLFRCTSYFQRLKHNPTKVTTNVNDSVFLKTYGYTEENKFAKDSTYEVGHDEPVRPLLRGKDQEIMVKLLHETSM